MMRNQLIIFFFIFNNLEIGPNCRLISMFILPQMHFDHPLLSKRHSVVTSGESGDDSTTLWHMRSGNMVNKVY